MVTKLKSKIKSYLSNIWLIEVLILLIVVGYIGIGLYKNYSLDLYLEVPKLEVILVLFISIFILIKVLVVLVMKKGKVKLRGNFIASISYVLKNGFSYEQTRKTLVLTIIFSILFFIGYLYLLAIGGVENNMLVRFFKLYPFKGSMLLVILPTIGIMYSIKKTIEILKVNDELKKINDGDLDYNIVENGADEILELIKNITKIKDGYKIAVEETLRNEKLKTELVSNVSHDLRTPLTSIINYVNILQKDDITEEERKDYLKIVEQKSKKLKVLIDELFEMSKINSGKIELHKDTIDIVSLIHQVIGEYAYLYDDKNIQFKVESFSEEILMNLDGQLISRAIENIIINSLKYSLDNTRVYVDIKKDDDFISISFKNIANYNMEFDNNEIFERFARGDKSRNSNIEGSGLGLAIIKSIIEVHQGKVRIFREGDMFKLYIYLPIDKNE